MTTEEDEMDDPDELDGERPVRAWPEAVVTVARGFGCMVVAVLFLVLAFSTEAINIIRAVRGH